MTDHFTTELYTFSGERNMKNYLLLLVILLLSGISVRHIVYAQACCSSGTPLLSTMELPGTPAGQWQFAVTYNYNYLDDVVAGTQQLGDSQRRRISQSILLEISYGLTSRLSVSTMITGIQQERRVRSALPGTSGERTRARGIGDGIVLLKYTLHPQTIQDQRELSVGVGPKIPLGSSQLKNNNILLPADLQPGSGAWDMVFWAYGFKGFVPRSPISLFSTITFRLTGTNERFGTGNGGYSFGDEFQASIGAGYRTDTPFDASFLIRYRTTKRDRFDGDYVPNTGGHWIYAVPSLNIKLFDAIQMRIEGQIPVYRNLNGTQLTTTFTSSFSIFYTL